MLVYEMLSDPPPNPLAVAMGVMTGDFEAGVMTGDFEAGLGLLSVYLHTPCSTTTSCTGCNTTTSAMAHKPTTGTIGTIRNALSTQCCGTLNNPFFTQAVYT